MGCDDFDITCGLCLDLRILQRKGGSGVLRHGGKGGDLLKDRAGIQKNW